MKYGLAIDIGTTNIKMVKIDLEKKNILGEYQRKNSQARFGKDVLSRIQKACHGKKEELTALIREDILLGMRELSAEYPERIGIAGNTTMMALLCGDSVEGLQDYPFTPKRLVVAERDAVCLAPAAGAFIGGDVVAGLSVLPGKNSEFLFIDLGTNGEMVLQGTEGTLAVSAAAGPAFEYMVDASGSMLLEVLKEAFETGIVDETGLLSEEYFDSGYLWCSPSGDAEFLLTQQKIRDLQLAKAAIRTGVDYLLEIYAARTGQYRIPEQVFLAGGMGIVSEEACLGIGMFPAEWKGRCQFLGNTALQGAVRLVLCPETFCKMQEMAKKIEVHNLAAWSEFNERFINNINFPQRY